MGIVEYSLLLVQDNIKTLLILDLFDFCSVVCLIAVELIGCRPSTQQQSVNWGIWVLVSKVHNSTSASELFLADSAL